MQSYNDADSELTGRCKERRKVANNTWAERRPNGDIAIRLHDTDIVTYSPDGSITLNTGGWFTVTTKERMNRFTTFGVSSVKGEWQVALRNPLYRPHYDGDYRDNPYWSDPVPYRDGMRFDGTRWHGIPDPDEVLAERARRKKVTKDINAFIKSITPDMIVTSWENTGGDCLLCRFAADDEMFGGHDDCLESHVEEHYFHATLAYRAIKAKGYPNPEVIMQMIYSDAKRGSVDRLLTDALRSFLKKRLVQGVAVR